MAIIDVSTRRDVAFPGFSNTLSGDYSTLTSQLFGELAYGLEAGAVRFEPYANFAYVNLRADAFTERGGASALSQMQSGADAAFVTIGTRIASTIDLEGVSVTAKGMIGWRHGWVAGAPTSTMQLAGSDAFTVAGAPIGQDALVVDAGLDFNFSPAVTFGVSYGGQFGAGTSDHTVKATLGGNF